MMKPSNILTIALLLAVTTTLAPMSLHAEDLIDQSSNVFKFQQKMANNGNVGAQYKLGLMYETGDGVTASLEQAKQWYTLAADGGSRAARQRNAYLRIKSQGYDQAKDIAWLASVKTDAIAHKAEALLLLGQIYREGLGVKKDLNKAMELLQQVQVMGTANVDKQIVQIQKEMAVKNKNESAKQERRVIDEANLQQENKEKQKKQRAGNKLQKEQQIKQQAESERLAQEAKIKRYEKAMQKLRDEQKKIDEQQKWASGSENSATDDGEF